jgi:carbon-monoxide dehydrogenase medium subunit
MRAAVGVGGVCSVPVRLYEAEADLLDRLGDADTIARAAARCADLDAVSDFHGKARFRRSVATALVRTAITTAYRRAATGKPLQ